MQWFLAISVTHLGKAGLDLTKFQCAIWTFTCTACGVWNGSVNILGLIHRCAEEHPANPTSTSLIHRNQWHQSQRVWWSRRCHSLNCRGSCWNRHRSNTPSETQLHVRGEIDGGAIFITCWQCGQVSAGPAPSPLQTATQARQWVHGVLWEPPRCCVLQVWPRVLLLGLWV